MRVKGIYTPFSNDTTSVKGIYSDAAKAPANRAPANTAQVDLAFATTPAPLDVVGLDAALVADPVLPVLVMVCVPDLVTEPDPDEDDPEGMLNADPEDVAGGAGVLVPLTGGRPAVLLFPPTVWPSPFRYSGGWLYSFGSTNSPTPHWMPAVVLVGGVEEPSAPAMRKRVTQSRLVGSTGEENW